MGGVWAAARHDLGVFLDHWFFFAPLAALGLAMAGALGAGIGFANLFRDDRRLFEPGAGGPLALIWGSPAFWGQAALTLLFGAGWMIAFDAAPDAARRAWSPGAEARLLGWVAVAGGLYLWAGWVSTSATLVDGARPEPARVRREMQRRLLGFAIGLGAAWLAWRAAAAAPDAHRALPDALAAFMSSALIWLYLMAAVLLSVALWPRNVLPCLSIAALLTALFLVGGVFTRLSDGWGEGFIAAVLLWIAYANGARFKLRIPGFRDPEKPGASLYDRAPETFTDPNAPGSAPPRAGAIPPTEALDAWLAVERRAHGPEHKPKLALLCASGGAYRASFWTGFLLDHFSAESGPGGRYEGLARSIRLVAGASGGMVAGAYFVALAAEGRETGVVEALEADILGYQGPGAPYRRAIPIPRDSLTPVVQRLVRGDLPSILRRGRPATDRGRALDGQWATLDVSFKEIAEAERAGRAPSIVISPMLVESGAPAFFSNLDLGELRARSLGLEDGAADIDRESVELFDAFPSAWPWLTLATAVRLNATFPYVSPAVSLPTIPRRRVVDAGYYDNYGVDVATAFLLTPSVKAWIQEHCSGVAVLQARAFPSGRHDGLQSPVARAFQWLTSPLEGVFNARASSQMFRNNQQLRLVSSIYDVEMQQDFVQSFAFEAAAEASLSWYLPDDEYRALRNLLPDQEARVAAAETADEKKVAIVERQQTKLEEQLDALAAFWARP